jgi:hypothetical protein
MREVPKRTPPTLADQDNLPVLQAAGLWQAGRPLRLHLGCGEQHFDGYLNIDYPPESHNVMNVQPDAYANILRLNFPAGSVDEIRLHHVFEHFNRVTALALLIKWHVWLKEGGQLRIETPDLAGSAKTLSSARSSWKMKMAAARHLAGDQAAAWGYHLDHWFPERYERTLARLGFGAIKISATSWPHEPHLANVEVTAAKKRRTPEEQLEAAEELLWESTVADVERPTFNVWSRQLRALLKDGALPPSPTNAVTPDTSGLAEATPLMPKLSDYGFNVYSQNGEDGIVEKIFSIIGTTAKVSVEFGAWDGFHFSNTANLWAKQGWKGILIELDPARFKQLVENTRKHNCHCVEAKVESVGENTLENILKRESISGPIDLLSIDVDGDDYHILQSLGKLRPRVIICEYNPTIPPLMDLVAEPGNYFGCSPFSLVKLAEQKAYKLVAVTLCNCLFVREEDFSRFADYETSLPRIALTKHLTYLISGYAGDYVLSREPSYGCTRPSRQKFARGEPFLFPGKGRPKVVEKLRRKMRSLLGKQERP